MKYAFYCHGGSQNHGCEAIVNTLSKMIKTLNPENTVKLYSFRVDEDKAACLPDVDEIDRLDFGKVPERISIFSKIKLYVLKKLSQKKADDYYYSLFFKDIDFKGEDVYISVGGDNYCYGGNHMVIAFNKELRKLGKKTVLWGCSVGEENLTAEKVEDLKGYDLIVARETLTYDVLKSNGICKNTVLYPDPAFALVPDYDILKTYPVKDNTLGLNISNMLNQYAAEGITSEKIGEKVVEHILTETDMNIKLIPHVTRGDSSDIHVLREIYKKFENNERVSLIPDTLNTREYKAIISQCKVFIGARTHSTIAAYSTCVPTFVFGYSIKSLGIAKDLFGDHKGLVAKVYDPSGFDDMMNDLKDFLSKTDDYKAVLEKKMPDYIRQAESSVYELSKI